jgi:hypothetical protein
MSDAAYTYDPLAQSLAQLPPIPDTADVASEVTPPPQVEEEDESSLGSHTVMQRIVQLVPPRNRSKVGLLETFLKSHPSLIRISSSGRPIIAGKEIQGATVMDIIRSLYVWRKDQALPRGTSEVLHALQSVGVPSGLLSTQTALAEYNRLIEEGGGEESHTSEEEEEGTPQKFATPAHSSMPPLPPAQQQQQPKVAELPSTSHASRDVQALKVSTTTKTSQSTADVKAPRGSTVAKGSPSMIPTRIHEHSAIPTVTTKREASKATSQSGQGYWPGCWMGPPLWPGFGQPKAHKPSLPGKPIRWLRLY